MSLEIEEANETQQLMQNEDEGPKISHSATSPVTSNKMSSEGASFASRNPGQQTGTGTNSVNESTKVSYLNERRLHRDHIRSHNSKPKHVPKETTDVKHMEKALLELLDDFHSGKLSAFGTGCSMEQMINIRDQQEHLARLHFRLCGEVDKSNDDNTAAREKMSQLVHSLEQLSTSIEHLHMGNNPTTSDK